MTGLQHSTILALPADKMSYLMATNYSFRVDVLALALADRQTQQPAITTRFCIALQQRSHVEMRPTTIKRTDDWSERYAFVYCKLGERRLPKGEKPRRQRLITSRMWGTESKWQACNRIAARTIVTKEEVGTRQLAR